MPHLSHIVTCLLDKGISNIYFLKDMTNFIKETHKKGYKMGYGIPTLLLLLFYVNLNDTIIPSNR